LMDTFHNAITQIKLSRALVPFSLLMFVCLAGYHITTPGLYYDELLFVNAALGGKSNMFIHFRFGELPIMLMPYIGALKAWIYYPIFKLFDVTAYSIRWPVVAIGALTLWINYRFMKTAFSRSAAIIFVFLAAVEPSSMFYTRLDWGPTALMMLFRGLLLLSIFAWIKNEKPWFLFAAVFVSVFGVFDKLNFIWFVSATIISLLLLYPDRIVTFVKSHRREAIFLGFLCAAFAAGFVLYTSYHVPLGREIGSLDWSQRWIYLTQQMLRPTLGGTAIYTFIIGNSREIATLQLLVLGITMLAALSLLTFTLNVPGEWRKLFFIFCFIFFTLLQMYFTRQATGPHHAAMIAPLWLIPISVGLSRAFKQGKFTGWLLKGIAVVATAGVFVSSIMIDTAYLKGFRSSIRNPRWDAGLYELVNVVRDKGQQPIVCVDWGFGTVIYGLLHKTVNVQDIWPTFKKGLTKADVDFFERSLLPQQPLFIVFANGKETFPETTKHFFGTAAARGWHVEKYKDIKGQAGDNLAEIYSVRMNSNQGINP